MSKPIIPLIILLILFFSFANTTISAVPSQSFPIGNGKTMTNQLTFHNSLSGNKSFGAALKANAHLPNSISFHNKFQQDLLPRFMAKVDNIHHQNPQSRVILKENDKWRLRVMADGPSEPDSDGNGHSNNANSINEEEDDELTKALKAELAEKFVIELDEIKNEWLRNEVLRKMFEEKKEDFIINAIHLLSSVAVVSGLGIITYEKTLSYIRALAIVEHISMAEYYLSVVEGFIKECQIEKGSKLTKLTPKEIKECLLSNLHLDLLKNEFLDILGIHEDGNEKNSNNDKPIQIQVKEKFTALNMELEKARPFLRALKPVVKYDNEAKLARERLTKTYNLMYRLKSLLNICDYFQGWKEEIMPEND